MSVCRPQVVDVVSTWRSVGPKLSCDSRPLMVQGVCQLLALVPQLAVESDDYEVTTDESQHVHLLPRCHPSVCVCPETEGPGGGLPLEERREHGG